MIGKFLNWLVKLAERRCYRKLGGIPIMWILYKPHIPKPNVFFNLHPTLRQDEQLTAMFQEIADRIREVYPVNEKE